MTKLNIDCIILIINNLQNDKKSLYSCLLVNRKWCSLVVPILWEKYDLSQNNRSKRKLFATILSCLPSSSKQLLFDNGIKLFPTIFLKPPLFNYISFCKSLNSGIIDGIVRMVEELNAREIYKRNLLEQEICKLFISQCKNIKKLSWCSSYIPLLLSLFPEAPTFFSQLYFLNIYTGHFENDYNALYKIAQICKDLNTLIISGYESIPGLISLVDAQKNLKCVKLVLHDSCEGGFKELGKALAKKCETIDNLELYTVNPITPSFLASLINLKRIKIDTYWDCVSHHKELQRYLAISEFPELQYLHIRIELLCSNALPMLIEKTKGNILHVDIHFYGKSTYTEDTGKLIKAVTSNCPKIKFLSTYLNPKDFIHIRPLLLNCKNLQHLEFKHYDVFNGDELLEILTKFSPNSLNHISISGYWEYSIDVFERFFESCRERNLLYFEISPDRYITENHRVIVKKYVNEGVIKEVMISNQKYFK